ncbi:MAG: hypothetical protein MJZ40_01760 [Bacteroidaceae bacterium]|nr:hypothetical protein [Bacteroidaceae bacterium]
MISFASNFYDNNPATMLFAGIEGIVLKNEEVKRNTEQHRRYKKLLRENVDVLRSKKEADRYKHNLPVVFPAALLEGGKKQENIVSYTPFFGGDLDQVPKEMLPQVLERLRNDPHTIMAALSPGGYGVRVFYWFSCAEELNKMMEGKSTREQKRIYEHVWRQCSRHLEEVSGVKNDESGNNPVYSLSLAHDPDAYFNWNALPLEIDLEHMPKVKPGRPRKSKEKSEPAHVELRNVQHVIEQKLKKNGKDINNGRNNYLHAFASEANRMGVDEQEVVDWAMDCILEDDFDEKEIRAAIGSAYSRVEEFGTSSQHDIVEFVREKVAQIAEMRNNQILAQLEIRFKPPYDEDYCQWHAMTKRDMDTLFTYMLHEKKVVRAEMEAIIQSHGFAQLYHPMKNYLESLPEWKQGDKDYIHDFFMHLNLKNPDDAPFLFQMFRTWFLRMVAMSIGNIDKNQLSPILTGRENVGKTYFVEQLLPPELRDYYRIVDPYEKFDKDFTISASRTLLINLDERTITRSDGNQIKSIISGGKRKARRPYGMAEEQLNSLASYALTTNDELCIAMDDGSRRFFVLDVVSTLNFKEFPIDYSSLYAQAYHEVKAGNYSMQLSQKDLERLKEVNKPYTESDPCEEAIWEAYIPAQQGEPGAKWVTATNVKKRIFYGMEFSDLTSQRINKAMKNLGFIPGRKHNQPVFLVKDKPQP